MRKAANYKPKGRLSRHERRPFVIQQEFRYKPGGRDTATETPGQRPAEPATGSGCVRIKYGKIR